MSKIKLTPKFDFFEKSRLIEIYKSSTKIIEFSVLKENQILFPFVKCKDFIQDFMYSEKNKENIKKYEFIWEYQNYYDNNEDLIIVCKDSSNEVINKKLLTSKRVINNLEKILGFKKSDMKSYNNGTVVLFYISYEWYTNPVLLSLYLLLLRNSDQFYNKQIKTIVNLPLSSIKDSNLKMSIDLLKVIYFKKYIIKKSWNKIKNVNEAHNSGCVNYTNSNREMLKQLLND